MSTTLHPRTGHPASGAPQELDQPAGVSPVALLRFIFGLSQHDLAARAGLSTKTIGRVERGELPNLRTATAIAQALDSTVTALFPTTSNAPAANQGVAKTAGQRRHGRV